MRQLESLWFGRGVVLWTAGTGESMPWKRNSEEKIMYASRQAEGGKKVSEICREMGVFRRMRSTVENGSTPGWESATCASCVGCGKKTEAEDAGRQSDPGQAYTDRLSYLLSP